LQQGRHQHIVPPQKSLLPTELSVCMQEVCCQIWATLYDYPCLKSCPGLVQYVKDAVRLAWGLVNQVCTSVVSTEPVLDACYIFVISVPAGHRLHFFLPILTPLSSKGTSICQPHSTKRLKITHLHDKMLIMCASSAISISFIY